MADLPDVPFVTCHPKSEFNARAHPEAFGLPVVTSELVPPGVLYLIDPTKVFDPRDMSWGTFMGRVDVDT